jgi:hypothetical protein
MELLSIMVQCRVEPAKIMLLKLDIYIDLQDIHLLEHV